RCAAAGSSLFLGHRSLTRRREEDRSLGGRSRCTSRQSPQGALPRSPRSFLKCQTPTTWQCTLISFVPPSRCRQTRLSASCNGKWNGLRRERNEHTWPQILEQKSQ